MSATPHDCDPDFRQVVLSRRERLTLALAVHLAGSTANFDEELDEVLDELVEAGRAEFEGLEPVDFNLLFEMLTH